MTTLPATLRGTMCTVITVQGFAPSVWVSAHVLSPDVPSSTPARWKSTSTLPQHIPARAYPPNGRTGCAVASRCSQRSCHMLALGTPNILLLPQTPLPKGQVPAQRRRPQGLRPTRLLSRRMLESVLRPHLRQQLRCAIPCARTLALQEVC